MTPIIDTLQPLGKFPAVNDKDVQCGSERLDAALAAKASSGDMTNALNGIANLQSNKVDKVSGKGLSSNDYSDAEKAKVSNAASEISKLNGYFTLV